MSSSDSDPNFTSPRLNRFKRPFHAARTATHEHKPIIQNKIVKDGRSDERGILDRAPGARIDLRLTGLTYRGSIHVAEKSLRHRYQGSDRRAAMFDMFDVLSSTTCGH